MKRDKNHTDGRKQRRNRLNYKIIFFAAGIAAGVMLLAGMTFTFNKTSDTEFCVSCHSMQQPLAEYQGSIHFQNTAGVRAECADCHIPDKPIDYLLTKLAAVKDVVGEITGKIDTPEKYNAHKLSMAQSVWKTMRANDSATCRSCHRFDAMDILAQRTEARKEHPVAMEKGQTCIDCHQGVAHIPPDMSENNSAGAQQLTAAAAKTADNLAVLYTIKTQPFTLSATSHHASGTLLPSVQIAVLQRQEGHIHGRLSGWQQEGVNNVIYAESGRRILSALVDETAVTNIVTRSSKIDSSTGQQWHQVTLDLWLPAGTLIGDLQAVWDYGQTMMSANCSGCHGLTPLRQFTANQWIGVINGMASRTSLDPEQLRLLTQYVQKHASDMPPSANH